MQAWWTEATWGQSADQQMVSAVIEGYHHMGYLCQEPACVNGAEIRTLK